MLCRQSPELQKAPIKVSYARPTSIDGLQPHNLEIPSMENHRHSTSEDSLEGNDEEEVNDNCIKYFNENAEEEKRDQSKDSEDEAGLSDEGLGDLTSEASNSPQPPVHTGQKVSKSGVFCKY